LRSIVLGVLFGAIVVAAGLGVQRSMRPGSSAPGRVEWQAGSLSERPRDPPLGIPRVDLRHGAAEALAFRLETGDWWSAAELEGLLGQEAFRRADRVVDAWLSHRSPQHGLLPRLVSPGHKRYEWNYEDTAADCYSHLVIQAHLLNTDHLPALEEILATERALSGDLPQGIDLNTGEAKPADDEERIFGAVEYAKDGLLAVTECIDAPPWYDRLVEIVDQIMARATVQSDHGLLPSDGSEKNGELLQVLARLYHRTREARYLEWGRRIADAYCLEVLPGNGGIPASHWDFASHSAVRAHIRLRDHANEIIGGLVEWVIAETVAPEGHAATYRPAVEKMLVTLLDRGRDEDGFWRHRVHPRKEMRTSEHRLGVPNDNWGYLYSAYVAYALSLSENHDLRRLFLDEARAGLHDVTGLRSARWEGGHYDGYADSIESALYMLAVFEDPQAEHWVHDEIGILFAYQQDDGFVDRSYLDGNFVRTALLYGLWTSAGVVPEPWNAAVRVGAVRRPDGLRLHLSSDEAWAGVLRFDGPRHREHMGLPFDYPRLNAWPEWFAVEEEQSYEIEDVDSGERRIVSGSLLRSGLPLRLERGRRVRLIVR
jgi:hypothetical protein